MQITKLAFGLLLIAIVQLNPAAHADELVRFDSAVVKPSPFLERKAREQGVTLPQAQTTHLLGYLSRPEGDGPFPAVVVMISWPYPRRPVLRFEGSGAQAVI